MDGSEISISLGKTNKDFSFKEWMVFKTKDKITNRYKQSHIAEDMDVNGAQLSRFLNGNTVTDKFYDKWMLWYLKIGS
jgi:hypothetical protein